MPTGRVSHNARGSLRSLTVSGETGYVTPEIIQKSFPKGSDKTRVFVCGPPGQVKAIAGAKDGPRQGELQGVLKELGYTADDVFKY